MWCVKILGKGDSFGDSATQRAERLSLLRMVGKATRRMCQWKFDTRSFQKNKERVFEVLYSKIVRLAWSDDQMARAIIRSGTGKGPSHDLRTPGSLVTAENYREGIVGQKFRPVRHPLAGALARLTVRHAHNQHFVRLLTIWCIWY